MFNKKEIKNLKIRINDLEKHVRISCYPSYNEVCRLKEEVSKLKAIVNELVDHVYKDQDE